MLQQVLVALNHYAGGAFQRTTAICGGVSQPTVSRVVKRVSQAICEHKRHHLKMPTEAQLLRTAGNMNERFKLPRFGYAVEGMMARFDSEPRGIPVVPERPLDPQDFFSRKGFHAINCQVICNDQFLILDLDLDWPGVTHDARVWAYSTVRQNLETVPGYLLPDSWGLSLPDFTDTDETILQQAVLWNILSLNSFLIVLCSCPVF